MVIMTEPGTEKRIDALSNRIDDLRASTFQGFARVDADIRELRGDNRALRAEIKAGFGNSGDEFRDVRTETKAGFDNVAREFTAVRGEIKDGIDRLHRQATLFLAGIVGSVIAGATVQVILSHS